MAFFTKSGNVWRTIQNLWIKQSGTWRQVQNGWIKQGGVWRQFYSRVTLPTSLQYFMVGGGGGTRAQGGGGAGNVIPWTSVTPVKGTTSVVVGGGGAGSSSGGTSSINIPVIGLRTCVGGGGASGGNGAASGSGRAGGSFGQDTAFRRAVAGGGGGGFSSNGTSGSSFFTFGGTCNNFFGTLNSGSGGTGYTLPSDLATLFGFNVIAGGGQGNGSTARFQSGRCTVFFFPGGSRSLTRNFTVGVNAGSPGNGQTRYGGGANATSNSSTVTGRNGVVVFKYPGNQRLATGGNSIVYLSSTNMTYHIFTSSGSFTL